MARGQKSSKDADRRLPANLTQLFIEKMESALLIDSSPKGKYLKETWLTKFCDPSPGKAEERCRLAISKWLATERRNSLTNSRLSSKAARSLYWGEHTYQKVLLKAKSVIRSIIGDSPSLSPLYGDFSGGATTSKKRTHGHPAVKFLAKADVTRAAYPLFFDVIRGTRWDEFISTFGLEIECIRGNVIFTVPKSSDIDRVAAKEPDLNIFLQKLFGSQIRRLLLREGVNLNDQTINGELARLGSLSGNLITIDLSSASDSVTTELVRFLLPSDWFYYLNSVRSPETFVNGEWHQNEMFSSMGNGFTFELESLIFYSIVRAVCYLTGTPGRISVYGDDIVAPTDIFEGLSKVLSFAGFLVNESKSCVEGPFRESCGAHWFAGMDIKPFYLRRPLKHTSDLILVLNSLVNWASVDGIMDPTYEEIFNLFKDFVPCNLWGGQDLTSRSALVTGDAPRKRLVRVTTHLKVPVEGSYLHWLLQNEPRLHPPYEPVAQPLRETGISRLRRNTEFRRPLPLFLTRVT